MYIIIKNNEGEVNSKIKNDLKDIYNIVEDKVDMSWVKFEPWARLRLSIFGYLLIDNFFVKEV